MTEVSIIVPVYNLEKYLPKCIDSILNQTFTNFELILVNDGSTDLSGEICEKYAKEDSRIKVLHKKNGGVASARNVGLEIAKGNYIGFVDNDDFINKYMFEKLYENAVHYSADIVVCDYLEVTDEQSCKPMQQDMNYKVEHYTNTEALNQLYTTNNVTFVVPWNKLYKRHLFKGIKYKVGNSNDDETIAHKLLYYSVRVTYIRTGLYYYIQRKGSQMDSNVFHIKKFDAVYAFKDREVFFRKINERELHQKALLQYMERFFLYYYMAKKSLTEVNKELKELKYTFDKTLIHLLKHKRLSWRQKFMCVVFSINPSLFDLIKVKIEKRKKKQRSERSIL